MTKKLITQIEERKAEQIRYIFAAVLPISVLLFVILISVLNATYNKYESKIEAVLHPTLTPSPTATHTLTPTATSTLTPTSTVSPTPTPEPIKIVVKAKNVIVYELPRELTPLSGHLEVDKVMNLVRYCRDEGNYWVEVPYENSYDGYGWIRFELMSIYDYGNIQIQGSYKQFLTNVLDRRNDLEIPCRLNFETPAP